MDAGATPLARVLPELPTLRIATSLSLGGSGQSRATWPAAETATPDGGSLRVGALEANVEFGSTREQASGTLTWEGVRLDTRQFGVHIAPLRGEFAYEDVLRPTLYGQSSYVLDGVTLSMGPKPMASLGTLRWAEQRAVENGRAFVRSQVHLDTADAFAIALRDLSVETQLENIDLEVWKRARDLLQGASPFAVVAGGLGAHPTLDANGGAAPPADTPGSLLRDFLAAEPRLAAQGSTLINDETLRFEAAAHSRAAELPDDPQIEEWSRLVDASLSLLIPAALLDPVLEDPGARGTKLRNLMELGILRRTPATYEVDMSLEGGELRFHGVPMGGPASSSHSNSL